jgi:hypothetical protein
MYRNSDDQYAVLDIDKYNSLNKDYKEEHEDGKKDSGYYFDNSNAM